MRGSTRGRLLACSVLVSVAALSGPGVVRSDEERDDRPQRSAQGSEAAAAHMRRVLADQLPSEDLAPRGSTACSGGSAAGYPCSNVDLMAFLPNSSIGGGTGNDCWGWIDPLTGREYALMGRSSGTSFVDITEPASPIYLGNLPPHTVDSIWRGIKVHANHAFIVSEASGHGMQVFDLRQLRDVTNPPVTFGETAHYAGFGTAHTIAVNEQTGFAYVAGSNTCSGGLHVVKIQNPALPVFAGCVGQDGYTHETQCVIYHGPDTAYSNHEICFSSNEDTLTIVDVTNKSNPIQLSRTSYSGSGYTHQGWLTDDHVHFLLDDELDEQQFGHNTWTRVWNVSNLDGPFVSGVYQGPTAAIDHNLYVYQGRAYEANYRAGLRVLDLAAIAAGQLSEVAYFDIYPASNSANFNGAWSTYPYFTNGVVIVSGIEQGLFVLRTTLDMPDFGIEVEDDTIEICDPGSGATLVDVTVTFGYSGDVTLSAEGLPAAAMAAFNVNPVDAPGQSEMTVTTTGLARGEHPFVVRGTDGILAHERDVTLVVAGELPGPPQLIAPADGATDQPLQPLLSWTPVPTAAGYLVELATDAGFASIVYSAASSTASHGVTVPLTYDTTYHWRVSAVNACGTGLPSAPATFRTLGYPPILLVDDDDGSPDVRLAYTAALDALGWSYATWDTGGSDDEPDAAALAPFPTVIWLTGDSLGPSSGPGAAGENALTAWLDASGCLLVASQDYARARGLTPFMQSHLGVASFTDDAAQLTVEGRPPVFAGLGPYSLVFPYTNRTDILVPGPSAAVAFDGSVGSAGVDRDTGVYRTTFWGFGLEGVFGAANRRAVLERFLDWCAELAALDGDGDGVSNGQDCAAADPALWSAPSPAQQLRLSREPAGNLVWLAPAQPGAAGVTYDLLRGVDATDFAGASCVESGETDLSATDLLEPVAGELLVYLVRVTNGCGSNLGSRSNGTPRTGAACP